MMHKIIMFLLKKEKRKFLHFKIFTPLSIIGMHNITVPYWLSANKLFFCIILPDIIYLFVLFISTILHLDFLCLKFSIKNYTNKNNLIWNLYKVYNNGVTPKFICWT